MAGMSAAAVALIVVVVGAVNIRVEDEPACQIVCHSAVGTAGKAAEHLDAGLHQSYLRAGADAAAENNIGTLLYQETDQRTVALPVGGNHLRPEELSVFGLIEFELCTPAKMLEHLTVFKRYCDLHDKFSFVKNARSLADVL